MNTGDSRQKHSGKTLLYGKTYIKNVCISEFQEALVGMFWWSLIMYLRSIKSCKKWTNNFFPNVDIHKSITYQGNFFSRVHIYHWRKNIIASWTNVQGKEITVDEKKFD